MQPIEGVPGTDAVSSKRGYYYQDVATALAWLRLGAGQTLRVEVAEDYALEHDDAGEVNQIRDVKAPITLVKVIPFLENVVQLLEQNQARRLSFVYRTTGRITKEQSSSNRPEGIAGLEYWEKVKQGEDPTPLIEVMRRIAPRDSRLARFLGVESNDQIAAKLILAVTWATREPSSEKLQRMLSDSITEFVHNDMRVELADIGELLPVVIDAVTQVSIRESVDDRQLTRTDLVNLLKEATLKKVPYAIYRQMERDSALVRNVAVDPIDRDIEHRLQELRKARVLLGTELAERAAQLAAQVRTGGQFELSTPQLRSLCLSWCARMLVESDEPLAKALLQEAKQLSAETHIELVEGLILGKYDKASALRLIASNTNEAAQTIRYAIHRRGDVGRGLEWIATLSLRPTDFDPDGMYLVLADYMQQKRWDEALTWVEGIPDGAAEAYPVLLQGIATALLARAIAKPVQHLALEGLPVFSDVPLSNEPEALEARRRAALMFQRFHKQAASLGLTDRADDALEMCYWLQLKDRVSTATATADILQRWEQSGHDPRWLPLVLAANLRIDKSEFAVQLDRRAIMYGSLSYIDARARLALILATPGEEWIGQWAKLKPHFQPYFTEVFLEFYEIEALIQMGRLDEAGDAVQRAVSLPSSLRDKLKMRVDESGDAARALESIRATIKNEIDEPGNRQVLIEALVKAGRIEEATIHAEKVFSVTGSHDDAERWMGLLQRQQRWEEIEVLLDQHPEQVEQSKSLPSLYLDALIRHGRWQDAWKLANDRPELIGRRVQLEIHLAVYSGNWEKLWEMLESGLKDPNLSLNDQRAFAHLATNLGRIPAAKKLTFDVAKRCGDDAGILMDCYMLAVRGRWEDDSAVAGWVQSAVLNASDEGPVQSKSLEDLMAMAPEWRERTNHLVTGLAKGEMYLSLAAKAVRRPLISLMLGTAESNRTERDFRRRSPISAFAGVAKPSLGKIPSVITLDQTALLTLGHLRVLPKLLAGFQQIWLPHSVGAWLFEERQEIQFHQPSRIFDARVILDAIARKQLHLAIRHADTPRELVQRIGRDLAELIRAAQVDRDNGVDAYVVRVAPVHLATSLGRTNADVSEFEGILRSTRELVQSLHQHGVITEEQASSHNEFLSRHDTGWNSDSQLPSGATLYLDDLTVSYFHHLDLWESAQRVFRLVAHPDLSQESLALTELESNANFLDEVIEDVRRFLVDGQNQGIVKFLRKPSNDTESETDRDSSSFLLVQSLVQQQGVEAVIVDDRAANGFPFYSQKDGSQVAMRCSLDILDWLRDKGVIDTKARFNLRNDLRRSGYLFIPLEAEELVACLNNALIRDHLLVETAGARAIRENHLLTQAAGFLQVPAEGAWLSSIGQQITEAVTAIWCGIDDVEHAGAKSEWLVELGRWDGFAGSMPAPWTEERLVRMDAIAVTRLLANHGIPKSRRQEYSEWIESEYLDQLRFERPRVFDTICDQIAEQLKAIPSFVNDYEAKVTPEDAAAFAARFCKEQLDELPDSVQIRLSADDSLLESIGLTRRSRITISAPGAPSFDTQEIYRLAEAAFLNDGGATIEDANGASWAVKVSLDGEVLCEQESTGVVVALQHARLVSPDAETRIQYLDKLASTNELNREQLASWFKEISAAPIDPRNLPSLENDLNDSPLQMLVKVKQLFSQAEARRTDFVPVSPRYYNRLVLPYGECTNLSQFAVIIEARELSVDLVGQVRNELLWSTHTSLVPMAAICAMDLEALRAFCTEIVPTIDLWSLVGLIESISQRPDAPTTLMAELRQMLTVLGSAIEDETGRLRLTVALGSLVDGGLSTCGLFNDAPVFWRRHASLAHAALIERAALSLGVPPDELASWAWSSVLRFQIATVADLPREPRWSGFLFNEAQLRQECLARVMTALEFRREEFGGLLDDLVFGDSSESLASKRAFYLSALPGPLEGATLLQQMLPDPLLEQLRETLVDTEHPLANRVMTIAHLSGMGEVADDVLTELAAAVDALRESDSTTEERGLWPSLVMRLAQSAAGSRHSGLASSTLQLIHSRAHIPLGARVLAGLIACGAHSERGTWTAEVVEFIERCVGSDLDKQQAEYLVYVIGVLGDAQPLLRPAIGKTLARVTGVAKSIN